MKSRSPPAFFCALRSLLAAFFSRRLRARCSAAGDFYLGHKQMGIIKVVASIVLNIIYMAAAASDSAVLFGVVLLVMLGYSAFLIACMIMSFMGKWIYAADANGVPTV